MRRLSALAPCLALLVFATNAHADWPPGGKVLMKVHDSFHGVSVARVFELPSGELLVLGVGSGGNSNGFSLQRIGPTGDFAPGWPTDGLLLGEVGKTYSPREQGYAVDDSACFWHASNGLSYSPGAQLSRPEPAVVPAPFQGWRVTTASGAIGVSAAPAPGGAYIVWDGGLQRLTRSGAPAPGWPAGGVSVGTGSYESALLPDGAGGVVVLRTTASPPRAQRMDQNGVRHAGWPATGLALGSDPVDYSPSPTLAPWDPLVPSGPDHMIAGWMGPFSTTAQVVRLQRFSLDGTLDPAWPSSGLTAVASDTISGVTFLGDGMGGVHILWYAHNRPKGTHIRADGTFVPGLGPSGVDLAGSDPNFVIPTYFFGPLDYVVAGAAPDGGLLFAYEDNALAPAIRLRVRWLAEDYSPSPSEPASGRLVYPAVGSPVRAVHQDGVGGAYLAWEAAAEPNDPNGSFADHRIIMTRLLPSSLVGVPPIPRSSVALALSAPRPNPARDAVSLDLTLADDSPARVELLDVAGRVRRTQPVAGVGSHAVTFADLGPLSPGLYFARATSRSGERCVRVVVTR